MFPFAGSWFEVAIYLLCVATSMLCAYLLARAYIRSRNKLLVWSSAGFALLALNNLFLALDVLVLPDEIDLTLPRIATTLLAVGVMLYGFIWES